VIDLDLGATWREFPLQREVWFGDNENVSGDKYLRAYFRRTIGVGVLLPTNKTAIVINLDD
jgi:hypothetical protein